MEFIFCKQMNKKVSTNSHFRIIINENITYLIHLRGAIYFVFKRSLTINSFKVDTILLGGMKVKNDSKHFTMKLYKKNVINKILHVWCVKYFSVLTAFVFYYDAKYLDIPRGSNYVDCYLLNSTGNSAIHIHKCQRKFHWYTISLHLSFHPNAHPISTKFFRGQTLIGEEWSIIGGRVQST